MYPSYLNLLKNNQLQNRVELAYSHLKICDVCALACPVDRYSSRQGACRTGINARVSNYGPHHGEEYPLSGHYGSGTIFFSRCNLRCQYCQNFDISQSDSGYEVEPEDIAEMMLELQNYGCHNINFVSPSHVVPQILAAVLIAAHAGLHLPLVYNTGGYDSLVMLALLRDVIDIYMPDMKYADSRIAHRLSKVPHYSEINQQVVREMHRQVGDLQLDVMGIARRGLLVRHLVLPNQLAGTDVIIRFLADEISKGTYVNLMDQYHPCFKAPNYPEINRPITRDEYQETIKQAFAYGLSRLDKKITHRY